MKPTTMYAARIMCGVSYSVARLKNTCHGSTATTFPWLSVNPPGEFIQEFAAITATAPPRPVTAIGMPVQKCAQPGSRCHPYR